MSHTQKRCRRKHTCIVEQHVYATETRNSSSYYAVDRPRTPDVTRDLKNVFARGIYALRSLCTKSHLACEAGVSIKPGAQAPGSDHQGHAEARENGRQREISSLSPAIAGSRSFYLAR
jgi:hypothetical protein